MGKGREGCGVSSDILIPFSLPLGLSMPFACCPVHLCGTHILLFSFSWLWWASLLLQQQRISWECAFLSVCLVLYLGAVLGREQPQSLSFLVTDLLGNLQELGSFPSAWCLWLVQLCSMAQGHLGIFELCGVTGTLALAIVIPIKWSMLRCISVTLKLPSAVMFL